MWGLICVLADCINRPSSHIYRCWWLVWLGWRWTKVQSSFSHSWMCPYPYLRSGCSETHIPKIHTMSEGPTLTTRSFVHICKFEITRVTSEQWAHTWFYLTRKEMFGAFKEHCGVPLNPEAPKCLSLTIRNAQPESHGSLHVQILSNGLQRDWVKHGRACPWTCTSGNTLINNRFKC